MPSAKMPMAFLFLRGKIKAYRETVTELGVNVDDGQLKLYSSVFLDGCKYAEIAFSEDKNQVEKIKASLFEIFEKLKSVYREVSRVKNSWQLTEQNLIKDNSKGLGGIIASDVCADIENFLTQGKGALDIFANQFLRHTVGFNGKWNHERIKKHLRNTSSLDQEIVSEIKRIIDEEWDSWLEDFCADRDQHHEKIFDLSPVKLVDGKPGAVITRRNGVKISDVLHYVDQHYKNLCGLIGDMTWLICAAKAPALKAIRLDSYYFIKKEITDNQKPLTS